MIDEDGRRQPFRLKSPISSARWRSDSPPTVFDWLMRHWFRKRAAFTRPNFGTAISMSNTFAVDDVLRRVVEDLLDLDLA